MRLRYLVHYPEATRESVKKLLGESRLGEYLLAHYPTPHVITDDKGLYDYALEIKNSCMRKSQPLSKVIYDGRINIIHDALGVHTFVSRVQGGKLKAKNEIRIATLFKKTPEPFLRMIVVHELAHLKEKEHNKAFYSLCEHMEPGYHRLEFDLRLYLTHLDLVGTLYGD